MTRERALWIHAGTHKTGTSVVQHVFGTNVDVLRRSGLCYPRSGWAAHNGGVIPAHFNLIGEMDAGPRFSPELGGIADVLAEVDASGCRTALISAEGYHQLYRAPDLLERLRDRIAAAGFVPRVLLYVRPQAEYIESLYAQLLRRGNAVSFAAFVDRAIAEGAVSVRGPSGHEMWYAVAYELALDAFARVFGPDRVTVRAYESGRPPDWILRDVAHAIGVQLPEELYGDVPVMNERLRTGEALRMLRANTAAKTGAPPAGAADGAAEPEDALAELGVTRAVADVPFEPLRTVDALRIARRFQQGDARITRAYGARVTPVGARRLRAVLAADLGFDASARAARRAVERVGAAWCEDGRAGAEPGESRLVAPR